jgi:maltose alpha-D-glucosyltransferase/alpha-amylase
MDDIKATSETGPDLSYDFVTRPAYHHALVTADTEFLRLTLRLAMEIGIDQASLVHALQNHDELTYELVHFTTIHKDDVFELDGGNLTGAELAQTVQQTLRDGLTGEAGPYNLIFTTNGIACTTASVITAVLGITDLDSISEEQVGQIKQVHLLLAMYNALQPGVFALSGWDLCGMLPLDRSQVARLMARGDTRWINRSAHDLMGFNPAAEASTSGMPKARSLYGTLPEQLEDPSSFARQLERILAVREEYGIAKSALVDVPDVSHRGMLVMVHRLETGDLEVTVLNFSGQDMAGTVRSEHLDLGAQVTDVFSGEAVGTVDDLHSFYIQLPAFQGTALLVTRAAEEEADGGAAGEATEAPLG